jgi:ABC-type sugar transport system permease subunit
MRPRRRPDPYLLLAPSLLLLGVFFLYPLAVAAKTSLYAWDLLTPPTYVGLGNYRFLWESGEIARALTTTIVYSAIVVVGSMSLGLGFALALNREGTIVSLVRSAVFSAYVISWVAVALLFCWMLDPDAGLLSRGARAIGLPAMNWLGDPHLALYTLAAVSIWKITGYAMIVFLAGLTDIPRSVQEAAALDGAGALRRFWHITWPLLRPSAAFVATTSLIVSFQAFDVVRIMTQGGPVHSTELFVYAIYQQIFMNLRVGRASALVVVFSVLVFVLALAQLRVWKSRWQA